MGPDVIQGEDSLFTNTLRKVFQFLLEFVRLRTADINAEAEFLLAVLKEVLLV